MMRGEIAKETSSTHSHMAPTLRQETLHVTHAPPSTAEEQNPTCVPAAHETMDKIRTTIMDLGKRAVLWKWICDDL